MTPTQQATLIQDAAASCGMTPDQWVQAYNALTPEQIKRALATAGYSAAEVSRTAGVTPRQLQWWHENGLVKPTIVGHTRRYTADELRQVCLFGALRRKGISLQTIRRIVKRLAKDHGNLTAALEGSAFLVVDPKGKRVYLVPDISTAVTRIASMPGAAIMVMLNV